MDAQKQFFIFDLDGTPYSFSKMGSSDFLHSPISTHIRRNGVGLLQDLRGINPNEANTEYERINQTYNFETSIGFEREHGVNRNTYFQRTWNIDPSPYIQKNPQVVELFEKLRRKVAILTSAPRVWAANVLQHLGVYPLVENRIFTGETDIRKPKPEAFLQVASIFPADPKQCVSIGDQESTDIIPAKKLGMKTILVGGDSSYADLQIQFISQLPQVLNLD